MSEGWAVVAGSAAVIYLFKSAGPLLLGGRVLPAWLLRLATLLPAALLAALVGVASVAEGRSLDPDARLVGVAVAALALWRRANFVIVIVLAAAATALTRQLLGS